MFFVSKCINLFIRYILVGSNNIIIVLVNKRNENNFDIWIDFLFSWNIVGFEM